MIKTRDVKDQRWPLASLAAEEEAAEEEPKEEAAEEEPEED